VSLGVYPEVNLKKARPRTIDARQLLDAGVDPSENRRAAKAAQAAGAANSFEVVGREWIDQQMKSWVKGHGERILTRFERDIFPWIGARPIADLTAPELLTTVRRIEKRGALETAHRALGNCGQVFRYAIATGRAKRDPTGDLRGALPAVRPTHFAAITDPKRVGALMRAIDGYEGSLTVRCALRLAPLVFVRPGELRKAEWAEMDLDRAEWNIPAARMKMRRPHIVPLSKQAVSLLRELQRLSGQRPLLFPNERDPLKPMGVSTIVRVFERAGYAGRFSPHSFRGTAATLLREAGFDSRLVELQLAHIDKNKSRAAYDHAEMLGPRRAMLQAWADLIDAALVTPKPMR
jgi:integrase